MVLDIITATWKRPKELANVCQRVRRQSMPRGIRLNHIIVSDGRDVRAEEIARMYGSEFAQLTNNTGEAGIWAKQHGLEHFATGQYVCFWDDDNVYDDHAASVLLASAIGVDVGIVQTEHFDPNAAATRKVPLANWNLEPTFGQIDTMCMCVRTEVARKVSWVNKEGTGGDSDFKWYKALRQVTDRVRFLPITIGVHKS